MASGGEPLSLPLYMCTAPRAASPLLSLKPHRPSRLVPVVSVTRSKLQSWRKIREIVSICTLETHGMTPCPRGLMDKASDSGSGD